VASVGYCQVTVNGRDASGEVGAVLVPSVSYLPSRVLYRTYNVTALLDATPGAQARTPVHTRLQPRTSYSLDGSRAACGGVCCGLEGTRGRCGGGAGGAWAVCQQCC
jgi:hypothetical protein